MSVDNFATASGRRLRLGKRIGKGGEGSIFLVEDDPSLAVKIYTDGKQMLRQPKVAAVINDKFFERSSLVAFPMEAVVNNGAFAGFTMRKIIGSKPMHQLCSPGDRKSEFPAANFRFMVRVALNFARAISGINSLGVVVGDINESLALVDDKAIVTVIDSDSFQYRHGAQTFRCVVGTPFYTPPELQGSHFERVDRTINHDAFGLAVILFEILFMGRHPFSGIYRGQGDQPDIAKAIREGRFAYSPDRSVTQMEPPPHGPLLADFPTDIAQAFGKAFVSRGGHVQRPAPSEWVSMLERLEKNIVECRLNPAHHYSGAATSCPWCRFETGFGTVLFIFHRQMGKSTFDIAQVTLRIQNVQSPGTAPDLNALYRGVRGPGRSQEAADVLQRKFFRRVIGLALAGAAVALMINGFPLGFLALAPAAFFFFTDPDGASLLRERLRHAEGEWKKATDTWNWNAGSGKFDDRKTSLLSKVETYQGLPRVERNMLADLVSRKRELQLKKHLESFKLARAKVEGIGDGRKMTLRSFNIETAWDIRPQSVLAVPGFGTALTGRLIAWRQSLEASFKFNAALPTDPGEVAKVRNDIAVRKGAIEGELLRGIAELEMIRAQALTRRQNPRAFEGIYFALKQAQADSRFI